MISLSRLTRRLADTPGDFLAYPGPTSVPAVVSDVLVAAGGSGLDARGAKQFESADENWLRLVLVAAWLAADEELLAVGKPDDLLRLFTGVLPQLAQLVRAEGFTADPDRREELARLTLRALSTRPSGETAAQAEDRLSTVDSVRRHQVLIAAKEAEERAKAVRKAMEEQRAREAAARYSQV